MWSCQTLSAVDSDQQHLSTGDIKALPEVRSNMASPYEQTIGIPYIAEDGCREGRLTDGCSHVVTPRLASKYR